MKTITKLWILIAMLAILAPIGIILPELFKAETAWGEWGPAELKELAGRIPAGLARLSSLWSAPMPDYAFKGWQDKPIAGLSAAYIISAIAGISVTILVVIGIGKFLAGKGD